MDILLGYEKTYQDDCFNQFAADIAYHLHALVTHSRGVSSTVGGASAATGAAHSASSSDTELVKKTIDYICQAMKMTSNVEEKMRWRRKGLILLKKLPDSAVTQYREKLAAP
eukprot:TRINITY_DN2740_c0_g3_i1.p1 TRINITY_DN2740_c0_g3~~TRINITY_DN2740_c0_g3_i1.p1  ORF type:complete len:112 (-),score=29.60 TRINITY_DN2740_c0_g3_i1:39-374(-)